MSKIKQQRIEEIMQELHSLTDAFFITLACDENQFCSFSGKNKDIFIPLMSGIRQFSSDCSGKDKAILSLALINAVMDTEGMDKKATEAKR